MLGRTRPTALLLSLTWLASSLLAQSKDAPPSPSPIPRFVSRSSLVLIPTVVTDHSGAHITGLTKDDFGVLENGHTQKIAIFEEVKTEPGKIRRVEPTDAGFTNAVAPDAKSQRLTLIVLDTLNTRFQDQVRARRELLKFVDKTLQANEPVALMTISSSGLRLMNDFTTDPQVLAAAVKKVRGQPSAGERSEADRADLDQAMEFQQRIGRGPTSQNQIAGNLEGFTSGAYDRFEQMQQQQAAETTLRALREIAESFSGVPGRKTLIWATGGAPFVADDPSSFSLRSDNLLPLYEAAWNALNQSQVSVYPLDMGGLFNPGFVSPRFGRSVRYRRFVDSVSNLENFAKMTGGRLCEFKLDLSGCYNETQKDASEYYVIGYYADTAKGKTGWRKLEVTVPGKKVDVHARTSYYVRPKPPDPKKSEREDMDTAILSPTDFSAVPILVRWTGRTADGDKIKLNFRFNVAAAGITIDSENNNRMSLAFGAFAKTPKGIAGDFVKELEGNLSAEMAQQIGVHGVVYDGAIAVPPGKYTVRFIVRDNLSGRVGTVSVPVDAAQVPVPKG